MQTLLQILAVIGIILLCIIGLVLLVAGLVLFVPIRYRVYAQKEEEFSADIKLSWLLHLITLKYEYPNPGELILRVLGIKVDLNKKEETNDAEPQEDNEKVSAQPDKEKEESAVKKNAGREPDGTQKSKTITETKAPKEDTETSDEEVKKSPDEKKDLRQNILFKIKEFYDKIKKVIGDIRYYWDLLQKKENRLLLERCKKWLLKILKNVKPKVLSVDAIIGTGSPDTTGYVLAVYGMLSPLYGYQINIVPDFDEKIFEGKILIKGKVTIFVLLYYCVRIYFDKQMQKLIEILKGRNNENGRKSV